MGVLEFCWYLLIPWCLINAYRRRLGPNLWVNIVGFYMPAGAWMILFVMVDRPVPDIARAVIQFFVGFAVLVHFGAWLEPKLLAGWRPWPFRSRNGPDVE